MRRTPKVWNTWRLASHLFRLATREFKKLSPLSRCDPFHDCGSNVRAAWLALARDIQANTLLMGYRDGSYRR